LRCFSFSSFSVLTAIADSLPQIAILLWRTFQRGQARRAGLASSNAKT
jgi:hypothetical protein